MLYPLSWIGHRLSVVYARTDLCLYSEGEPPLTVVLHLVSSQ